MSAWVQPGLATTTDNRVRVLLFDAAPPKTNAASARWRIVYTDGSFTASHQNAKAGYSVAMYKVGENQEPDEPQHRKNARTKHRRT